jgi:hypothetical protein
MNENIERANAFHKSKANAIKKITQCFYPGCTNKAINSHILQKNGIISSIAEDGHVYEMEISKYKETEHLFEKIGVNKAFSFSCFCQHHDTELFKSIENGNIDFLNYRNCLLFTLRTIYNEKFRKLVNIGMLNQLISKSSTLFDINHLRKNIEGSELGIKDIEKMEKLIWGDLNNGTESFIFKIREISKLDVCLAAFYNYETSQELEEYYNIHHKQKEDVSDIFINLFPYKNKSILLMGYKKQDGKTVKAYVNEFFSDNEKRLERKITNLMMFQCETWIISNTFYKKTIEKNEEAFDFAVEFSENNYNERKWFDLNIFRNDFPAKFDYFRKSNKKAQQYE